MQRITTLRRWTLALLVALVALGTFAGSAAAAPATAKQPPANPALTRTYRAQLKRLKLQQQRLAHADQFAAKVDALVVKLKVKGKDTDEIEAALADFRATMASARAEWQLAADLLAAHAGFDADGKVTDTTQAGATLKAAHGHMEQAHTIARGAAKEMRQALAQFRKAARGTATPPVPVEP